MVSISIKIFFTILLSIRSELALGVKDEVDVGKREGASAIGRGRSQLQIWLATIWDVPTMRSRLVVVLEVRGEGRGGTAVAVRWGEEAVDAVEISESVREVGLVVGDKEKRGENYG